ncbi:MAG: B12-binding domain-containing radical SAM protein [Spirochaetes bacterium]|nr:MAG: B12-binding domain-containing radical SAM protein [Spirochaetota bacterium]
MHITETYPPPRVLLPLPAEIAYKKDNIMKVLLINPPYPFEESPTPPFGLMSLAAYLLREGVEVIIEDYIIQPYSRDRVKKVLADFKPDVVGATAVTMNVKKALSILKEYKEVTPGIVTVMGGPHVTFDAENILKTGFIDCVVRGEGEITFTELLTALNAKKGPAGIPGISYREGNAVLQNEDRPLIPDINVLPLPARHLVALGKYRAMGFSINMVTSRGCPHNCIFCVGRRMVGSKVRYFDVNRVVDEFEMLSKMSFHQINVVDDLFTANKARCMAICDEMIRRGISHIWGAFARVDTVSEDLLKKLKEANCTTLCFGIESGNQEILDRVKKKTTLEKCRRAAEMCKEVGIDPMTSYILGLPGETAETVSKTLEFAAQLSANYGFHILAPFPGTEVREKAADYGMRVLSDDWDLYDANQSVCHAGGISPEEIDRIVNEFNSSIHRYVADIAPRKAKGETLTDRDEEILRSIETFVFNRKIILEELVEAYPGVTNGASRDEVMKNFTEYLNAKTGSTKEFIGGELGRLVRLGCLDVQSVPTGSTVRWS